MPGQLDWTESCIEQSESIPSEPFGWLESFAAVFSTPALGALAHIATPALSALPTVLARVRHAELSSLWTPCQGAIVEDKVVEVNKLPVDLKAPYAAIQGLHRE